MNIAALQLDSAWEDIPENKKRIREAVQDAMQRPVRPDMLVLPEMSLTGFTMNSAVHETVGGEDTAGDFFSKLAAEFSVAIVAGYGENEAAVNSPSGRNMAGAWGPDGSLLGSYSKNYPFSYSGEDLVYESGESTCSFEFAGLTFGLFICYDLRFPEHFRRLSEKADVMIVIANWPLVRIKHWRILLRARAIENLCYVIGVNRVGRDYRKETYPGNSLIIDPFGDVLEEALPTHNVLQAEIQLNKVHEIRKEYPFLQDIKK